jgi:hypothetical protein
MYDDNGKESCLRSFPLGPAFPAAPERPSGFLVGDDARQFGILKLQRPISPQSLHGQDQLT